MSGKSDPGLAREWGLPEVWRYASVASTNDVARALAERGAPHGTAVWAEEQRAGRGQAGRGWASAAGLGAWVSVVLRPARLPAPALLPLLVGAAAAGAVDRWLPAPGAGLKWPNDLFVAGRKLGGVLCEAAWEGSTALWIVAGVGINVLHREEDFPAPLRALATSVRLAAGDTPALAEVAGAVASAVAEAGREPPRVLSAPLAGAIAARDVLAGRPVEVTRRGAAETIRGTALGIAPDGALLVRTASGALRPVPGGTVRPLGPLGAAEPAIVR